MKRYILLLASIFVLSFVQAQYNIVWRFGTTSGTGVASVSASPYTSASVVVRQQQLGPTDIFSNAFPSTGYTDVSADYNIQMIAKQGAI
ncbi:MAG: hypothetical protein QM763_00310 [Agriterribacter sp.]